MGLFGCKHDWEVAGYGDFYRVKVFGGYVYGESYNSYDDCIRAKRLVCLKCNKCIDEEEIWRIEDKLIKDRAEAKALREEKREALAKKMWENCKGIGGSDETV